MFKFVLAGTVATVATATHHSTNHHINDQIVSDIKAKATTWVPMEIEENPLKNLSHGEVMGLLGTIV
jgi:cathepsin B